MRGLFRRDRRCSYSSREAPSMRCARRVRRRSSDATSDPPSCSRSGRLDRSRISILRFTPSRPRAASTRPTTSTRSLASTPRSSKRSSNDSRSAGSTAPTGTRKSPCTPSSSWRYSGFNVHAGPAQCRPRETGRGDALGRRERLPKSSVLPQPFASASASSIMRPVLGGSIYQNAYASFRGTLPPTCDRRSILASR